MGQVVNLADRRSAEVEHDCQCSCAVDLTGPARCLHCGSTWEHTAPAGVLAFECPVCSMMKGVRYGLCVPAPTEDRWVCACGGDLFMLRKVGAPLCVNCGLVADGWMEEG